MSAGQRTISLFGIACDFWDEEAKGSSTMTSALLLVDIQNDYFPGGAMELVGMTEAMVDHGC